MESNHCEYKYLDSFARIGDILGTKDIVYEELSSIPSRDKLTFTNGFYVKCTALFVDIRGSSQLPDKHRRPKLAKLYRAYISEVVACMNGNVNCAEVNIVGDSVWGVFDTPYKRDIDSVFLTAAIISFLIDELNCKFKTNGISEITVGIGIAYGTALMIKAGYSGSRINDVVWMGDVVNEASNLCSYANQTSKDSEIMISNTFYSNLNDDNCKLLTKNYVRDCYHGNVVHTQ
jgi:class 3 adenylate cyclase